MIVTARMDDLAGGDFEPPARSLVEPISDRTVGGRRGALRAAPRQRRARS